MLLESSLRTFDNEGIVAQTFPGNIGPISGQCLIMIFDILLNNEKVILPFHFHRGKICRWVKANSRGKYIMQDWSRLVCKCCHARGTKVSKTLQVQNLLLLVVHMILSSLLSDLWTKTDFFAFQWRELWCCVSGQVRRRMIFKSWQRPNFLKSFVIKTCEFNWLWIRLTLFTCHCHQFRFRIPVPVHLAPCQFCVWMGKNGSFCILASSGFGVGDWGPRAWQLSSNQGSIIYPLTTNLRLPWINPLINVHSTYL